MMSSGYGCVVRVSGNEMGAHVEVSARNPLQHTPISGTKMGCKLYQAQYKL